ncbi:hypothetical protein C0J52_06769 [Blattella germanica]|nr:hypothetical protein C0J52_06769 [Blattella germanica]
MYQLKIQKLKRPGDLDVRRIRDYHLSLRFGELKSGRNRSNLFPVPKDKFGQVNKTLKENKDVTFLKVWKMMEALDVTKDFQQKRTLMIMAYLIKI